MYSRAKSDATYPEMHYKIIVIDSGILYSNTPSLIINTI
jgi:hypothetical protein